MPESLWSSTGLEVLRTPDFTEGRLDRPGTYVVCFGAEWCGPTRRFVPEFLALHGSVAATLAIADITDRNDPLWDRFEIRISPSVLVFRDGSLVRRLDGRRMFGLGAADLALLKEEFPYAPARVLP
jgi:Thioredoxin